MGAKWQTRAYGQAFADVLKAAKASDRAGNAVIETLCAAPHGYAWPDDADVKEQFTSTRYYGAGGINQNRLRLILGAIDRLLQRADRKVEPADVDYDDLQVEHVIPQQWQKYWPVEADDPNERAVLELARAQHIHRIGNLTLTSGPRNNSQQRPLGRETCGDHEALNPEAQRTLVRTR